MTTARANIVSESAALVSSVKGLENQRAELKAEIDIAKELIVKQKRRADLLSAIMKRNEIPEVEDSTVRLAAMRDELVEHKERQSELKRRSQELQAQIDLSIAVRTKRGQYESLLSEVRTLAEACDVEQQRETELKLAQSHLTSELLKGQHAKRNVEAQLAAGQVVVPDLAPIKKKRQGLLDQTGLVRKKREVFEQELTDAESRLVGLKEQQRLLVELADSVEAVKFASLQAEVLEMAACNTDLRRYRELTDGAEHSVNEIRNLEKEVATLIKQCNEVT